MGRRTSTAQRSRRVGQRAFSIQEFCETYGLGRTKVYEEIKSGRLRGSLTLGGFGMRATKSPGAVAALGALRIDQLEQQVVSQTTLHGHPAQAARKAAS
jgi:hypothetical protein